MDSPQKNLGSMDGKMPPLLFPDANRQASAWAFATTWIFPVSLALTGWTLDQFPIDRPCAKSVFVFVQVQWCDLLEREEDAMDSALWIGLWCCAALQTAVAALGLLLPFRHRRIRRALAYLAVAVAMVGRYMTARLVPLAAHPGLGYLLLIVLIVYAAAALAQLLPCLPRRIRRALAYLAVAIVGCCILASFVALAADTGLLNVLIAYATAIFTLAVGDLRCLALLLGGEE